MAENEQNPQDGAKTEKDPKPAVEAPPAPQVVTVRLRRKAGAKVLTAKTVARNGRYENVDLDPRADEFEFDVDTAMELVSSGCFEVAPTSTATLKTK